MIKELLESKELITLLIAGFGAWVTVQQKLAVVIHKQETVEKDLDGIAELIGTARAVARLKLKKEKEEVTNG